MEVAFERMVTCPRSVHFCNSRRTLDSRTARRLLITGEHSAGQGRFAV